MAKTIAMLDFIKYLKNNYKDNTFLISNFPYEEKRKLFILMSLNDLNCAEYDNDNLLQYDIVINFPSIDKKNINGKFDSSKSADLEKILKDNNYCPIKIFYFDSYINEYSKVMLFGRKDKFPKLSE